MKKAVLMVLIGMLVVSSFIFMNSCSKKGDVIKIGAILPLSGNMAKYGQSGKEAIQIAVENFNKTANRKVEVIYEDDIGEVKNGVSAINKLITIDKVQLILGAMPSGITLGIAPIAEKNKVVLISPTSTAKAVTNAGDFIFRVCVSDEIEGKTMADYLYNVVKPKSIGILYINNDYGIGLKADFSNALHANGAEVVREESYKADETNFRSIISKFKRANIDALYIVAYKEQINFFKQCSELKFKPLFCGSTMIEDSELIEKVGDFINGTIYTYRSYNPESEVSITKDFVSKYKAKYNKTPDFYAAANYDGALVALNAISNCEYSGEKIKEYLYKLANFKGVKGKILFDKNGDIIQNFVLKKIINGKFVFMK